MNTTEPTSYKPLRLWPGIAAAVPSTVAATLELLYAAAANRGGVLAARLSRERAQTGITIPLHEGARRFFERPAAAPPSGTATNP